MVDELANKAHEAAIEALIATLESEKPISDNIEVLTEFYSQIFDKVVEKLSNHSG